MNTPVHLLLGSAVFAKPAERTTIWAALAGALMPDLSLYLLAGSSIYLLGLSPQYVFDQLYFSDAWQTIFAIDNSFFVWGALLAFALWRNWPLLTVFACAGLLHLALDLPLHHDDGRPHFWPISSWVFESPVSYWDRGHGADWVAPFGGAIATVAALRLWTLKPGWIIGSGAACLLAAELSVTWVWVFVFSG